MEMQPLSRFPAVEEKHIYKYVYGSGDSETHPPQRSCASLAVFFLFLTSGKTSKANRPKPPENPPRREEKLTLETERPLRPFGSTLVHRVLERE